jgi:hypothetical protein
MKKSWRNQNAATPRIGASAAPNKLSIFNGTVAISLQNGSHLRI